MTVSKTASATAAVDAAKPSRGGRKEPAEGSADDAALQLGELSELLGYSLKRAQLRVFEDFLRCVAPLQLTPELPGTSTSGGAPGKSFGSGFRFCSFFPFGSVPTTGGRSSGLGR